MAGEKKKSNFRVVKVMSKTNDHILHSDLTVRVKFTSELGFPREQGSHIYDPSIRYNANLHNKCSLNCFEAEKNGYF